MNLFAIFTILFILHFSSLLVIASSLDNHANATNNDRLALLAIKSEITQDPQGVLSSWNASDLHVCQWQGVTCGASLHQTQRVVALNLSSKGLVGTLSPFVGNLSFLHHLYLYNNAFHGHIPPQIGHLFRLRSIVFQSNTFEGEIPADISRCSKLEILRLSTNNLTGAIPLELGILSNLVTLVLDYNKLTGNLLNIVMNMTSLQILSATFNSFQGSIPDSIGQHPNLRGIALGHNRLSGTIPPSFYNLSSLQVINLEFNQLEGSLPGDIGFRFPQLTSFEISGNFFKGHVPVSLSNLTKLQVLGIYYNNFTGKFRFSATNMPDLQVLEISHNNLGTGEEGDLSFLQTLANCSQLQILECGFNNFGGNLPAFLGNWSTELKHIDLQQNQITGSLPIGLFNLINLEILGLRTNYLTGHLPPQIGQLTKLEYFSCYGNNLTGSIPHSIGNLSRLHTLLLYNNSFEGLIPSSLGDCTSLLYLSLSQNRFTGALPPHLFHASMLVLVDLSQNQLQGTIPREIGQLRNLVGLNITANAFSGEFPSSLGSCIGLTDVYAKGNFFSGYIPQSFKSLTSLQYLDLSYNKLSGNIPNFLSNFSLMGLDLSFNNLEGEVPIKGAFANSSAISVIGNSKLCGGSSQLHLPRCPSGTPTRGYKKRKLFLMVTLIIGATCLVVGVSIVSSLYLICSRRKKDKMPQEQSKNEHFPKVSYDMILKATNGFSQQNLVGRGHFGIVYKGVLEPSGMVVAIKVLSLEEQGASKSFMAECNALRNIRHRNLLKIVTACSSTDFKGNNFKALVYELMPNGNLQQWIHVEQAMVGQDNDRQTLHLMQRLNIAIDVACALDYLHNHCEIPIIHCDLKPSNILLDNDMVAHVGDFGLARFQSHTRTSTSSSAALKGTVGYAAPEYGLGSKVSKEGDIYSYSMVLIEMMTGKRPTDALFEGELNLHHYTKSAFPNKLTKIIDSRLLDDDAITSIGNQGESLAGGDKKFECIKSVIEIGIKCSAESPQDRMSIEDVVRELQITRESFVKARHEHHIVL